MQSRTSIGSSSGKRHVIEKRKSRLSELFSNQAWAKRVQDLETRYFFRDSGGKESFLTLSFGQGEGQAEHDSEGHENEEDGAGSLRNVPQGSRSHLEVTLYLRQERVEQLPLHAGPRPVMGKVTFPITDYYEIRGTF